MRNSSAQAWKGFIYYSFSELSHVFATLTYAYIAMYYDMFEGEGIGKGQKVLVIAERYRDVGAQFIAPTSGESAFQEGAMNCAPTAFAWNLGTGC